MTELNDDNSRLLFAVNKLQKEQENKLYGTLSIHFQNGKIVRVITEKSEEYNSNLTNQKD
ncbi:MAG: hypothetical protein ACUZ8E_17970 [Candidatus Anammoxibacter sp.]